MLERKKSEAVKVEVIDMNDERIIPVDEYLLKCGTNVEEPYLSELAKAEPVKVIQLQKLLHPNTLVVIKPCNHKVYYSGDALYIPKDLYFCDIRDISLRKKGVEESEIHGAIAIYIDKIEKYEAISDRNELEDINFYFSVHTDL